ncbi:ABC transporter ATP-binding protein [Actinoplanes sp. NPDC051851]|uniref:ABC transporter ATP-binding protein n=1 Tax=Actinoplanes sp. NPDC051851 TaxID=3154753 RepID=UPI0034222551
MTAPVIVAAGVRRAFGAVRVLDGVDLTVGAGEVVALLGGSGSGKSTLLRVLAGLDAEATGDYAVPARHGVVFQEHRLLPWKRVLDNVRLGVPGAQPRPRSGAFPLFRSAVPGALDRCRDALAEVGLADRERAWPAELSGGQAQRVAFARALAREPSVLLLDEPFGALDALTRLRMQDLFGRLRSRHGFAALLVTHDVDEALLLADRALILDGGRITTELAIPLDRPRAPDRPGFGDLRRHLLTRLGVPLPA